MRRFTDLTDGQRKRLTAYVETYCTLPASQLAKDLMLRESTIRTIKANLTRSRNS